MDNELHLVLKTLDCVMFKYHQSGRFETVFIDTPWADSVLPIDKNKKYVSLYGYSLFLDDFLQDAKSFWLSNDGTILESGIWTEEFEQETTTMSMHFEAEALFDENSGYLIIKNLARKFSERQKTLQAARELILSNEDLVAKHNYTQERIESVLLENNNIDNIIKTISKAVDSIKTGIIVTDPLLNPIMENPAVNELFNANEQPLKQENNALKLLLKLVNKQYPEFERILSSCSPWQGELCWIEPPFNMKWFMLSIIPAKDENQQLQHWIFLISDISRVKFLQQQNEKLTLIDHLTELPNRQYFWNTVNGLISQKIPFYALYIDIKNFREINEEFGHAIGDEVLITIAEQIKQIIKKGDVVARIGGDEFAIVLQNVSQLSYCQKVIDRLNNIILTPYLSLKITNFNISLTIGAACYPGDGDSVERLMKSADIAVTQAKSFKGLNYAFYNAEMEEDSIKQLRLKKELALALELNQFELYFQPIYDAPNQQVAKAEVLLRWVHPEIGLIMPDKFIPLAEETGLIVPLGKWVIEQACAALERLKFRGHNIGVAINLSPRQFNDLALAEFIEQTINSFNITASSIELEVTEGLLINNFESVVSQLGALRQVGISLSVDDFGTGYSSLSYLKRLPIDTLKIDRSFVMDLPNDNNDKAIVSAVIAMAHKLNLCVVAEGVEQQSQLTYLLDNSCDFIQGFLLSKPVTYNSLCDILDLKK